MKILEYNTESEADAVVARLNTAFVEQFEENTTSYTYTVKHPSEELWGVPIKIGGVYWKAVQKELSASEKLSMKNSKSSWHTD